MLSLFSSLSLPLSLSVSVFLFLVFSPLSLIHTHTHTHTHFSVSVSVCPSVWGLEIRDQREGESKTSKSAMTASPCPSGAQKAIHRAPLDISARTPDLQKRLSLTELWPLKTHQPFLYLFARCARICCMLFSGI